MPLEAAEDQNLNENGIRKTIKYWCLNLVLGFLNMTLRDGYSGH